MHVSCVLGSTATRIQEPFSLECARRTALTLLVMPASAIEPQPRGSAEFIESSVLEAVVPAASLGIDIKHELDSWAGDTDDEGGSILPFLSQRNVLLLGMDARLGRFNVSLTHA